MRPNNQRTVGVLAEALKKLDVEIREGLGHGFFDYSVSGQIVRDRKRELTINVVEIDPDGKSFRSSGGKPDLEEMRSIVRTYARGLGASGESDHAIRILQTWVVSRAGRPVRGTAWPDLHGETSRRLQIGRLGTDIRLFVTGRSSEGAASSNDAYAIATSESISRGSSVMRREHGPSQRSVSCFRNSPHPSR